MIAIGGTEVSDIRIGANAVDSVHIGATKVYPTGPTTGGKWTDSAGNSYAWRGPDPYYYPNGYWVYLPPTAIDRYLFYINGKWNIQIKNGATTTDEGSVSLPANTRYIDRIQTGKHYVIEGLTWSRS